LLQEVRDSPIASIAIVIALDIYFITFTVF